MFGDSNAKMGADAKAASAEADKASAAVKGDLDLEGHQKAASAQRTAAWKNRDAGNGTKADGHVAMANAHSAKAEVLEKTKYHADDLARTAEGMSKKAGLEEHGADPKDARGGAEMHADAARAHSAAASAYAAAGCAREQAYHSAKAAEHAAKGQTPAS